MDSLRLGLRERGYVEGRNIAVEYRWADGKYERLAGLAAELVRSKVSLIITQGTPAALAVKQATKTIPVVMAIVGDPVVSGIVASYARPGGNFTGSSFSWGDLTAKRIELLKAMNPSLARAGVLLNPDNPAMTSLLRAMEERAQAVGMKIHPINARSIAAIDAAVGGVRAQVEALAVVDDGLFITNAHRIADLAEKSRLPSIGFREYCEAGGLLAYGVDFPYIWRQASVLIDRILKGAKPADLPIQQADRFELMVNLKTAKSLGLTIPPEILGRADEIIE
jgi:putative ABC transport system substrate-binding protein